MTAMMAMPADVDARRPRRLLQPRATHAPATAMGPATLERSAKSEEAVTVTALRTT
jgi:hypothetical protein